MIGCMPLAALGMNVYFPYGIENPPNATLAPFFLICAVFCPMLSLSTKTYLDSTLAHNFNVKKAKKIKRTRRLVIIPIVSIIGILAAVCMLHYSKTKKNKDF